MAFTGVRSARRLRPPLPAAATTNGSFGSVRAQPDTESRFDLAHLDADTVRERRAAVHRVVRRAISRPSDAPCAAPGFSVIVRLRSDWRRATMRFLTGFFSLKRSSCRRGRRDRLARSASRVLRGHRGRDAGNCHASSPRVNLSSVAAPHRWRSAESRRPIRECWRAVAMRRSSSRSPFSGCVGTSSWRPRLGTVCGRRRLSLAPSRLCRAKNASLI